MALFVSKRAKIGAGKGVPLPLPPAQAGGLRMSSAVLSPRMGAADNSPAFQRWVRTRPSEVKAPEGRQSPIRLAEAGFSQRGSARADGPRRGGRGAPLCGSPGCRWVPCPHATNHKTCPRRAVGMAPASEVRRPSGAQGVLIQPRHPALKRWAIVCRPLAGAGNASCERFRESFPET
jgi:hypothetical protein